MIFILNILILLFIPILLIGIINKTKAVWAGRKGASILQPYYDFFKLLRKSQVISTSTSYIFQIAPAINLAAVIIAALTIPIINHQSIISFKGDFIVFAYLLALGRFFSLISAMDTGSSFEGMGASREASFAAIIEPSFFVILGSAAALTGHTSFSEIFKHISYYNPESIVRFSPLILLCNITCAIAFFIMILTEGCRVPVDDPNTHLELTMIHEVMILDNSGPDFALILYASAIKMFVFACIVVNFLLPPNLTLLFSIILFVISLFVIFIIIGFIESLMARLRMNLVPQFLLFSLSLSLIVFSITLLKLYGDNKWLNF